MKKQAATQAITDVTRDVDHAIDLAVSEATLNTIQASPKDAYHALDALRGQEHTVITVTTRAGQSPILLIEAPAETSDLAKAAKAFGTMMHVSIVAGGLAAEVVWHGAA